MTLATTTNKATYDGDGATTLFPVPFKFFDNAHVEAVLRDSTGAETTWTESTEYTLAGAGNDTGGTLTAMTAPTDFTPQSGETLVVRRVIPLTQETDYPEGGAFPASAHEDALDLAAMRDQQVQEENERSLRYPITDSPEISAEIPNSTTRANKYLAFDAAGDPIAAVDPGSYPASVFGASLIDDADAPAALTTLGVSAFAKTLIDDADAATARSTLGLLPYLGADNGNLLINGAAPYIKQRGAVVGGGANDAYLAVDRWKYVQGGGPIARFDVDVVTIGGEDWIEYKVSTAVDPLGAGEAYTVQQHVEGNHASELGLGAASATTVTLSFKHRHVRAGTYCVFLGNSANDRVYIVEYSQDVADTEESETITIPLDTGGTWLTGTNLGLRVAFVVAAGSNWNTAIAETWPNVKWSTSNQVDGVAATSDRFRIRDIRLDRGGQALTGLNRTYAAELALCERYYEKSYDTGAAPGATTDGIHSVNYSASEFTQGFLLFRTRKRGVPAIAIYSSINGTAGQVYDNSAAADKAASVSAIREIGFRLNGTGLTVGGLSKYNYVADAEI